ncbi:hypothetical protein [Tessaracoccus sp. MC1756]|uniref:T3SS (YopN, CesT) and YbjN peptide-binding chaperone 1 n=1 Tax=Tessaracoccus sp. MC1756 TaxID=2760311 RepID=UPI0016048759|nr:hypothetical protein [Tessaracoccus sp. MC1756]MBB1510253.1 hypothetical protein [Tessaracoccus sp. MC1756]
MAGYEDFDFDFDATQQGAWEEFTTRLDEVLSVMDSTADLTISVASARKPGDGEADEPPGIRFSVTEPGVIAAYVKGPDGGAPTEAQAEGLHRLAWDQPNNEWNTFHTVVDQENSAALAQLATETLAEVFGVLHPIFLEPDQLAEILKGQTDWVPLTPKPLSKDQMAVMPANRTDLDHLVDHELAKAYGHPPLRNDQGDVAIRVGSTMVFLRSTPDAAELVLFSALVHEVGGRSRACEVLNDLNVEARYGRFALHRDRVFVQISVAAKPFVAAHLHQALLHLSQIADGIDDALATKLGGRTTFNG